MESIKPENDSMQNQDRIYPLQTTFEYYSEKYTNFKKHVEKIADYYPDVAKWSKHLNSIHFAMFVNIIELKLAATLESSQDNMNDLFENEMIDNGINFEMIKDADMDKLYKYIKLFEIMLAD